jgi:hypothetical protein
MKIPVRGVIPAVAVCITMAVALAGPTHAVQTSGDVERFTAFAVNMGDFGPARSDMVDIVISRWSTAAERDRLVNVLFEKGADALLAALQDTPSVGYIRTPNSLAYDLRFAKEIPGEDGGRRIILVTDRPIGTWEAVHRPRTIDYPFTLIEIRVNRDGEGEGKMSIAARITANKASNTIELEDYAIQPVRLMSVQRAELTK